jgi:two-component system OmpR family sensor kinase
MGEVAGMGGHVRASAGERGPMPVRERLMARARRIAVTGLLAAAGVGAAAGWWVTASGSLALAAAALVGLAVIAWLLARRSTRALEALFGQEDRLMLSVAHEVRRPLGRLVVAADEGLSGAAPADAALREAIDHAAALDELIAELLEAARVMTGTIPLGDEVVRLDETAAAVARMPGWEPATVVVDATPATVIGSPRLLRLAIVNLVRNAWQHGYHGGQGTIRLRVGAEGVAVADDGPGMDETLLAELQNHELWIGLEHAHIGLGLAVASWAVEVHGGEIRLANRPGGGFEARLELAARSLAPPR